MIASSSLYCQPYVLAQYFDDTLFPCLVIVIGDPIPFRFLLGNPPPLSPSLDKGGGNNKRGADAPLKHPGTLVFSLKGEEEEYEKRGASVPL